MVLGHQYALTRQPRLDFGYPWHRSRGEQTRGAKHLARHKARLAYCIHLLSHNVCLGIVLLEGAQVQ